MMSSLLRLSSIDRPSLGLSKRFSLLSNNTVSSSTSDDPNSAFTSFHTLPSVERLDGDDFLNMFDVSDDEGYQNANQGSRLTADSTLLGLPELSASPAATAFASELHGNPIVRAELAAQPVTSRQKNTKKAGKRSRSNGEDVVYRSSVSSSNQSVKRSTLSSYHSRQSSVSSMTEDFSSSERSSKESDKENALHERLKRRSQEKRVSFSGRTTQLRFRASSETNLLDAYNHQQPQLPTVLPTSFGSDSTTARPASRGKRLGQAMADGLATSPPPTPNSSRLRSSQPEKVMQHVVPVTRQASRDSSCSARSSKSIPTSAIDDIDRVRVGIMSQLDNVVDLKACAQVSRDFYRAFQKYETLLVDCVLYKQSRAAWELRHSVRHLEKPSPFRLRSVQKDYSTISALEDFIVWRCESVLRPQSLEAFIGESRKRKRELEDAIWMVWTFCNVFGKTSMSDATLAQQTQWLNAGPKRTKRLAAEEKHRIRPCSMRELEDMSEIWRCLEILLSGFKGREDEARKAGLFDTVGETKLSDRDLLNSWIHDILSLGPKAVLTLSSCDFEQAKVLGITRWTPPAKGKSRSNFLKAAVEEVYRDRLMKEARKKALDYRRSVQYNHRRSTSDPSARETPSARPPVPRLERHSLMVNTRSLTDKISRAAPSGSSYQPFEIRPDCDPLSSVTAAQAPVLSPSSNPTAFSPLAMTKNASAKMGATLFPIQNRDQSQRHSIPLDSVFSGQGVSDFASTSDVIDPADKALALLVVEMGFSEKEAKRALALSDTGAGINIEAAIEALSAGEPVQTTRRPARLSELPAGVGDAQLARKKSKREICEGHCKPMLLVEPKRERVSGLGMVKRGLSYRMSFRKSNRLSVIMDDEDSGATNSSPSDSRSSTMRSGSSTNRSSAITELASATISALSAPVSTTTERPQSMTAGMKEHSPVSPITPNMPEWIKPDANPIANSQVRTETNGHFSLPAKPRITLQKVGTGTKKQGWSLSGRKRRELNQPEIIGYAY